MRAEAGYGIMNERHQTTKNRRKTGFPGLVSLIETIRKDNNTVLYVLST